MSSFTYCIDISKKTEELCRTAPSRVANILFFSPDSGLQPELPGDFMVQSA
jgi:hypothetical protein